MEAGKIFFVHSRNCSIMCLCGFYSFFYSESACSSSVWILPQIKPWPGSRGRGRGGGWNMQTRRRLNETWNITSHNHNIHYWHTSLGLCGPLRPTVTQNWTFYSFIPSFTHCACVIRVPPLLCALNGSWRRCGTLCCFQEALLNAVCPVALSLFFLPSILLHPFIFWDVYSAAAATKCSVPSYLMQQQKSPQGSDVLLKKVHLDYTDRSVFNEVCVGTEESDFSSIFWNAVWIPSLQEVNSYFSAPFFLTDAVSLYLLPIVGAAA